MQFKINYGTFNTYQINKTKGVFKMNYQSNLKKFESQLEKETNKLFKMYDQGKDLLDTEEQIEKVNNLKNIVESLQQLA